MGNNRKLIEEELSKMTRYDRKLYYREQKAISDKRNSLISKIALCFSLLVIVSVVGLNIYISNKPYMTVGAYEISNEEYNFYHTLSTNNYINTYRDYLSYFGLDLEKDFSTQVFDSTTGETWEDFFRKNTNNNIKTIISTYEAGKQEKYECDTLEADIDEFIVNLKANSTTMGLDEETYLRSVFGCDENTLRKYCETYIYSSNYSSYYYDSIDITDEEVDTYYNEHKDDYDTISGLYYALSPQYESGAEQTVIDAAIEVNKVTAEAINSNIKDRDSFISSIAASIPDEDENKSSYVDGSALMLDKTSKDSLIEIVGEWFFDASRKAGDFDMLKDDTGRYYFVYFDERNLDTTKTVDVRHILKMYEFDENNKVVEDSKDKTKTEIDEVWKLWEESDKTIDTFAKLANEHSEDSGSNTNGGLYEGFAEGDTVAGFNEWIFDSSRKPGDCDIVETINGYHIIYFVGENKPVYKLEIDNTLRNEVYNEWVESILLESSKDVVEDEPINQDTIKETTNEVGEISSTN